MLALLAALVFGVAATTHALAEPLTKITNIESSYPFWSPDGTQLVFQSDRNGNSDIYIMNVDGSGLARLTSDPASDLTPVWSPDGRRIAFQSDRDGNREIYVMNVDASNLTNVTRNPAEDSHPKWSSDGRRIIFDSLRDGNDELYVMNADGTGVTRFTTDPSRDTYASFSPDETMVLWRRRLVDSTAAGGFGNSEVFTMRADGSAPLNLTQHPAYDGWPSWSPDGTKIAFASDRAEPRVWHIYLMDLDGRNVVRLTEDDEGGGYFTKPIWSADGRRIVCTRTKDGNVEIFVIELHS